MFRIADAHELGAWIQNVLDPSQYDTSLKSMLRSIPTTASFADLPPSTRILIRADLDVPLANGAVRDTTRLNALRPTLDFCKERNLVPILFGHVGRVKDNSARPIAAALRDLFHTTVQFIENWYDERDGLIPPGAQHIINATPPGHIVLLENTRQYSFECALWDRAPLTSELQRSLYRITSQLSHSIAGHYIFDAIASSNHDWSSVIVPAFMDRVAISESIIHEFNDHVLHARNSNVLIFSGLKMDKLNDLEALVQQGAARLIVVGGALAPVILKGKAAILGEDVSIGRADDSAYSTERYFVSSKHIERAKRIVASALHRDIELLLPVDFVLDDGSVSEHIPRDRLQFDIGIQTQARMEAALQAFVQSCGPSGTTVFYNGVFGKFEDPRFESGTKAMVHVLQRMTEQGARTYVGGGEALLALHKYGNSAGVTHAFTCGGTILKAMSGRVIGYLSSLSRRASMASTHS